MLVEWDRIFLKVAPFYKWAFLIETKHLDDIVDVKMWRTIFQALQLWRVIGAALCNSAVHQYVHSLMAWSVGTQIDKSSAPRPMSGSTNEWTDKSFDRILCSLELFQIC